MYINCPNCNCVLYVSDYITQGKDKLFTCTKCGLEDKIYVAEQGNPLKELFRNIETIKNAEEEEEEYEF